MQYPWKVPDDEMFDNIPISGSSNKYRRSFRLLSENSLHTAVMDRINKNLFSFNVGFTVESKQYNVFKHHLTLYARLTNDVINEKFNECDREGKKLTIGTVPWAERIKLGTVEGKLPSGYVKEYDLYYDYFVEVGNEGFDAFYVESDEYGGYSGPDESRTLLDRVEHRCFPLRTFFKDFSMRILLILASLLMLVFLMAEANQFPKEFQSRLPALMDYSIEGELVYVGEDLDYSEYRYQGKDLDLSQSTVYWDNGIKLFLIDLAAALFFTIFSSKRLKRNWWLVLFLLYGMALAHGYYGLRVHFRDFHVYACIFAIACWVVLAVATVILIRRTLQFPKCAFDMAKLKKSSPPDFDELFFDLYRHCRLRVIWYEIDTGKKAPKYFDNYVKNLEKAWKIYAKYKAKHNK